MVHPKRILMLLSFLVLLFLGDVAFSQQVIRGPYLQIGTPTSVIVRWRTDIATESEVKYGLSPASLNQIAAGSGQTEEHEIRLTNLSPDTKYFYAVGSPSNTLAGGDDRHFFVTSPPTGSGKNTRIWILGDSGTANSDARAVRDAYYEFTGDRHTDLWLMLGDNAYSDGKDREYQKAVFENMYEDMLIKSVLWPTLGNHDDNANSAPGPYPYYDIFTLPKNGEAGGMASGTEAYYAFDYGDIHFIGLNSATSSLRHENSSMWTWLEEDLAANMQPWTIAFWHHPPYSKGSHDSDSEDELIEMREQALPRLDAAGVDLVLGGHSHSYERSFLIDGHHGKSGSLTSEHILDAGDGREAGDGPYHKATLGASPHEGAVYLVNGSSGKTSSGDLDHPVMVTSLKELGSLVLDIDGNRLHATFLDDRGDIRDTFTIVKGTSIEVGPPAQLLKISGDNQTGQVGETLEPFVVEVRDASNRPVSGVSVGFKLTYGDGQLSRSGQTSSSNGQAATTLTFGSETGDHIVAASVEDVANLSVQFLAQVVDEPDTIPPDEPQNVRVSDSEK